MDKTGTTLHQTKIHRIWAEANGSITWYPEGFFSIMDTGTERTYCAFGGGTYIYQPETRELFAQINYMNIKQQFSDATEHNIPWKRYFSVIGITGSTVKVHTIPPEYEIDWKADSTGRYQLQE